MSPSRTLNGSLAPPERSFSPRTVASQQPSRVTQRTNRTQYPPVPDTPGPFTEEPRTPSQRSMRRPSMHSVTPSESASNTGRPPAQPPKEPSYKPAKSVKSATELNGGGVDIARSTDSRSRLAPSQHESEPFCNISSIALLIILSSSLASSNVSPKPSDHGASRA